MQKTAVVKWGVFFRRAPAEGGFRACGRGAWFPPVRRRGGSACGRSDFFAAEKVTKKPPKPAVLKSLSDCQRRWPPSGAPCRYVASLLALTRSFIAARRRASARRRLGGLEWQGIGAHICAYPSAKSAERSECALRNLAVFIPPRRAARRRTASRTENRSDSGNREYPYRPRSRRASYSCTDGEATGFSFLWKSENGSFLFPKRKELVSEPVPRGARRGDAQRRARRNAATAERGNTGIVDTRAERVIAAPPAARRRFSFYGSPKPFLPFGKTKGRNGVGSRSPCRGVTANSKKAPPFGDAFVFAISSGR